MSEPIKNLENLRHSFDREFRPATPSESMLVIQLAAVSVRVEMAIPLALASQDPKQLRELTRLEEHFQRTLRLLVRMQTKRQKEEAALRAQQKEKDKQLAAAASSHPREHKARASWPAPQPPRAYNATPEVPASGPVKVPA